MRGRAGGRLIRDGISLCFVRRLFVEHVTHLFGKGRYDTRYGS